MKTAIARVAQAIGRLHREEPLALDGQIERIPGLLQRTLGHAQPVAAQQAIVVHCLAQLRISRIGPQQHGTEILPLGAIARGLGIGQVRGGRIKRLGARHQPGHRCIVSAVHRVLPFTREVCRRETNRNGQRDWRICEEIPRSCLRLSARLKIQLRQMRIICPRSKLQ